MVTANDVLKDARKKFPGVRLSLTPIGSFWALIIRNPGKVTGLEALEAIDYIGRAMCDAKHIRTWHPSGGPNLNLKDEIIVNREGV